MNKTVAFVMEIVLIVIYLVLVIFVLGGMGTLGLILIGVATIVIFSMVLLIDKAREKSSASLAGSTQVETPAQVQQPAQAPDNIAQQQMPSSGYPQQPRQPLK